MKPDAAVSRKVVRPQLSMIIAAVFFWVCVPVNGVCKRLQFTIKLADVTINIDHRYPYIYQACRTFEIPLSKEPDFTVSATDERIRNEFEAWEEIFHCTLDFDRWKGRCESDSLITSICDRMPFYDMFLMHAAVVAVDGVAYIFTAPSGTGKTTHTMLWKKHFGDRAVIVNGDKPLIRLQGGKVYVCSTPWKGKEELGLGPGAMFPVGGICIIEQNPENHIRRISVSEASRHIFRQVHLSRNNEETFTRFWRLLDQMMTSADFYLLQCNREPEASRLSYLTMRRKQNAENQKGISAAPSGR